MSIHIEFEYVCIFVLNNTAFNCHLMDLIKSLFRNIIESGNFQNIRYISFMSENVCEYHLTFESSGPKWLNLHLIELYKNWKNLLAIYPKGMFLLLYTKFSEPSGCAMGHRQWRFSSLRFPLDWLSFECSGQWEKSHKPTGPHVKITLTWLGCA